MSVVLFLILPSIILSIANSKNIIKSIIFSIISVPALLIIDYISHLNGQWWVERTVFPFKFFDLVPVENSFWVFFLTCSTLMFYEYFFDKYPRKRLLEKRFIPVAIAFFIVPIIWFAIGFKYPIFFDINYFYLLWGSAGFLIPSILFLRKYPKTLTKFVLTGAYFFYLSIIYELTALYLNWWNFPYDSTFIGWVEIFGVRFPLEEFIIWFVFCAIGILAWYEYFDDDRR